MQVHDNGDVIREETTGSRSLIEIDRLASPKHLYSRHGDVHERGIEFHARAARCGEDASPVGIAAGKGGLHERRRGYSLSDALGGGFCSCAANMDFDDSLRSFPVGNNLAGQGTAYFLQRSHELAKSLACASNSRRPGGATGEHK